MDLLVVTCASSVDAYQDLSTYGFTSIEQPIWGGLIANYVRNKGFGAQILDADAEGLNVIDTAKRIIDVNAKLTLFCIYGHHPSASTQCLPINLAVHKLVKEGCGTKTVMIGTHCAALPEDTLLESRADFICTGEGPYTVLSLLRAIQSNDTQYGKIGSLCYLDEGKPVVTQPCELISDFDADIPAMPWDLLPMDKYRAHNWHCFDDINHRQPYASLYTSWGCPFKCTFCCINAPFGKHTIRYLSPESVIKEIDILVNKYGVKNIKIPDEMFVLHEHHVIGICDLIIERGYDLNIWAYARIDTSREKFLAKLRQAGVRWLGIGVEAGNVNVRKDILKVLGTQENVVSVINRIKNAGIYVGGNYIFGLPTDTVETMQETLDLAMYLNTEWANFYCTQAYPGSALHKQARAEGWKLPESPGGPGWIGYAQHSYDTYPLATATLSNAEVLKFRDAANIKYFSNPDYLNMIEKKFGKDTKEHVIQMNTIKLKRRLLGD